MHYFLDPDFDPNTGILCPEESRHAIKSLRLAAGDSILVGNGKGKLYTCTVRHAGRDSLATAVTETMSIPPPRFRFDLAAAPVKNPTRFEWFLEKATETGVHTITPLLTRRTERPRFKTARGERIMHAAGKQSKRAWLAELNPLTPFGDVLGSAHGLKVIAHCDADRARRNFADLINETAAESVLVLIGPEGDFTPEEIDAAVAAGFTEADLGPNRLRTETAGVYCASVLAAMKMK